MTSLAKNDYSVPSIFICRVQIFLQIDLETLCADSTAEGTYSLLTSAKVLQYTMQKKSIIFKESDAVLLIIRAFNKVETLHQKVTEDKFRTVLLSTITHDIKTPLTVIKSNLSLLQDLVTDTGQDFYRATCVATDALEHYLRDIIVTTFFIFSKEHLATFQDIKQIFEGTFRLEPVVTSLPELFTRLREMVELPAKIKKLSVNITSSVDHKLQIDGQRLMQVLLNLTANGIKYTKTGHIDITATEDIPPAGGKILRITVQDTGVGIKPENMGRIFKMFGLVDKKMEMTGTGTVFNVPKLKKQQKLL